MSPEETDGAANQSIQRAAAVLRAVAEEPSGIRLAELSRRVSLAYPTVTRIVQTLERERLLARAPGGRAIVLGPEIPRLASSLASHSQLLSAGGRHIEVLAQELGESVELEAVVDGQARELQRAITVLIRFETEHVLRTGVSDGPVPLYTTSVGKLLFAHWSDAALDRLLASRFEARASRTITDPAVLRREIEAVRREGVAEAVDELEDGVSAMSVGVHDPAGVLIGIVNIDGPTARLDADRRRAIGAKMLRTAAAIEADLRKWAGA